MGSFKQEAAKLLHNAVNTAEEVAKDTVDAANAVIALSSNPALIPFLPMLEQGAKLILGRYGIPAASVEKAGSELFSFLNSISVQGANAFEKKKEEDAKKEAEKPKDEPVKKTTNDKA